MLAGLTAFVEGRIERKFWSPRADLDVRKLAALEALARHGRMQPKMLGSINLTPNQWPTAAVIDWLRSCARDRMCPTRRGGSTKRSRSCARGSVRRHDAEVQHRGRRLLVVADGQPRRQRRAADAGRRSTTRPGRTNCRAWWWARWRASSAAPGSRPRPTCGGRWRWTSSRRRSSRRGQRPQRGQCRRRSAGTWTGRRRPRAAGAVPWPEKAGT
jgi:hypothetical protein